MVGSTFAPARINANEIIPNGQGCSPAKPLSMAKTADRNVGSASVPTIARKWLIVVKFRRKDIRLPSNVYTNQNQIFSLTICTWQRKPWFQNQKFATALINTLHTGLFAQKCEQYAYCLMPDHLHLLVSPNDICLIDLINRWKSYTANLLRKDGLSSKCWQRSFYDHALRKEEEIRVTAEYIINNPVRAGMVDYWQEYAYSWHKWM